MTGRFVWTANESLTNCIYLSFSDWSSPGAFSFTNAASLIKKIIPLVNRHFCWLFSSKHHTKSPLHCNGKPRLVKSQLAFAFFYERCHFYNCECSASDGKIWKLKWHELYKLDHVTYWNAFSVHSSDFRFMSREIACILCVHSVYWCIQRFVIWSENWLTWSLPFSDGIIRRYSNPDIPLCFLIARR
jgi:hypothetical protein